MNLRPLAPYLEPHLDIFVLGSKLGLAGTIRLRSTKDELPEVRFQGDARLDEFSTAEGIATEGLLRWNSLRLSGIEASLNPPVVSVAKASLEDVFARLIIETNRTLNLMSALRWGGTNAASALPLTNLTAAVRPKVSLASVVVSNANVHFIDRSLQPNVNITLEHLSGTVSGLSSDDPERADVHLQGNVDKTARAEITGKINPWNSKQPLDLTVALKEIDLLPGDPYSGKYLGYRLKKGKLSAQLTYQVTERKLHSENHLTLDQLTLGQKVESADATKLPVRLAIALLKDRDGRIALDLPVNGSLDDPQFNLGKVVYRAIETVLDQNRHFAVFSPRRTLRRQRRGTELPGVPAGLDESPAGRPREAGRAGQGSLRASGITVGDRGQRGPADRPRGLAPRGVEPTIAGAKMECRREPVPCWNQRRRHRKPARPKFPESVLFRKRRLRPEEPSGVLVHYSHQIHAHRKLSRPKFLQGFCGRQRRNGSDADLRACVGCRRPGLGA